MAFIDTTPPEAADDTVAAMYRRQRSGSPISRIRLRRSMTRRSDMRLSSWAEAKVTVLSSNMIATMC